MRVNKHKVHKWTHHFHHFAEVVLGAAVVLGSHLIEVWAIGAAGIAAIALICLDCIEFGE